MQDLQPGQNRPITGHRVTVAVVGEPSEAFNAMTQIGAVLLTAEGRIRDPADQISAEQPRSSEGAVELIWKPCKPALMRHCWVSFPTARILNRQRHCWTCRYFPDFETDSTYA